MNAPTACYFPWTDMTPAGLRRALLFFRRIILYRLPGDQPGDYLKTAADHDLVRLTPCNFIDDESQIKRIIDDFSRWADEFKDPRFLSGLRQQVDSEAGSRLMTSIRGTWADPALERNPQREAQIFLHFARHLDRQRSEINRLLADVDKKEDALAELLGVEELDVRPGAHLAAVDDVGVDMMRQRLAAWAYLLEAYGPDRTPLVTDKPDPILQLDANLSRSRPARELSPDRTLEVLEPFVELALPAPGPWTIEETADRRPDLPEWPAFLERVCARAWTPEELPLLRTEGEAVSNMVEERWPVDRESTRITLHGYLIPGESLREAYLHAAGINRPAPPQGIYCGPIFEIRESRAH